MSTLDQHGDDEAPEATGLVLRHFSVSTFVRNSSLPLVQDVGLHVPRGGTLGVVGESGCGKSVTWLAALGLTGAALRVTGEVWFEGGDLLSDRRRLAKVRGGRIAMIFQDPSACLDPVRRIGWQIGESLSLHRGLAGQAARTEARRLLERVRLPDAAGLLDRYPHELSGGMNQRVAIAMALAGAPDVLIADEPTTALDATVQAQILDLLDEIRRDTGMALVLISHDLGAVARLCDRIAVMYAGRVVETARADDLLDRPAHPYTRGLLKAWPELDEPRRALRPIPGFVPPPGALPPGCAFAPRCGFATAACDAALPPLIPTHQNGGLAACIHTKAVLNADAEEVYA